jgi:rhodanese-related sulfurtransferase
MALAPAADLVTGMPATASVLDIRQGAEFAAGHFPDAVNIELATLASQLQNVPAEGPVVVMCGHGERAMTAASILEKAGRTDISVLSGAPGDFAKAAGRELEAKTPEVTRS